MAHIHKILVPMDGSPPSMAALSQALDLAEDLGATVHVLHVRAEDRFAIGSSTSVAKTALEEAERAMTRAIDFARDRLGDRLKQHVEAGDPIQKILEVAATVEPELIVMGTHGRVGRLHAILGSVAEAVVRNSARPVLTVRQPDGEEESFAERVHGRQRIAAQKPAAG